MRYLPHIGIGFNDAIINELDLIPKHLVSHIHCHIVSITSKTWSEKCCETFDFHSVIEMTSNAMIYIYVQWNVNLELNKLQNNYQELLIMQSSNAETHPSLGSIDMTCTCLPPNET